MQTPWTKSVRTLGQARDFVLEVGMCGVLRDSKGALPTLWDAVDALDKQPGEGGWGDKVWTWKNQLPASYPVRAGCVGAGCDPDLVAAV